MVIIETPSYFPIFELEISEIRMTDSYKETGTIAFNLRIDSINIYDFFFEGKDKVVKRSIFGDLDTPKILIKNSTEYLDLTDIENYSPLYPVYKKEFEENIDPNLHIEDQKESSSKKRSNSLFDVSIMKNSLEQVFCYRLVIESPSLILSSLISSIKESVEVFESLFTDKCMYYHNILVI